MNSAKGWFSRLQRNRASEVDPLAGSRVFSDHSSDSSRGKFAGIIDVDGASFVDRPDYFVQIVQVAELNGYDDLSLGDLSFVVVLHRWGHASGSKDSASTNDHSQQRSPKCAGHDEQQCFEQTGNSCPCQHCQRRYAVSSAQQRANERTASRIIKELRVGICNVFYFRRPGCYGHIVCLDSHLLNLCHKVFGLALRIGNTKNLSRHVLLLAPCPM